MSDSKNFCDKKSDISDKLNNFSNKFNKSNFLFFISGFSSGILATLTYSKYFLKNFKKSSENNC